MLMTAAATSTRPTRRQPGIGLGVSAQGRGEGMRGRDSPPQRQQPCAVSQGSSDAQGGEEVGGRDGGAPAPTGGGDRASEGEDGGSASVSDRGGSGLGGAAAGRARRRQRGADMSSIAVRRVSRKVTQPTPWGPPGVT